MTTRYQARGRICRVDSYEFPDPLKPAAKRQLRHHTEYQYMPKPSPLAGLGLTPESVRNLAEKFSA